MSMPLNRTDPRDTAASLPDVLQFMQLLWAVVHGLERTSKRNPRDRRRAILRLTARGARIHAARRGTVESAVADVLDGVSAQDREATIPNQARVKKGG
jgi:hypothetical protein